MYPIWLGAVVAQQWSPGLQISRASDWSCIWGTIHTKIHLINPDCLTPSWTIQFWTMAWDTIHFIYFALVTYIPGWRSLISPRTSRSWRSVTWGRMSWIQAPNAGKPHSSREAGRNGSMPEDAEIISVMATQKLCNAEVISVTACRNYLGNSNAEVISVMSLQKLHDLGNGSTEITQCGNHLSNNNTAIMQCRNYLVMAMQKLSF